MPFNTSNGVEGTTSELEWEFVVAPKEGFSYKERGGGFREEHPDWCRKPLLLSAFEKAFNDKNEQLRDNGHTEIIWDEIIAGRQYTGQQAPIRCCCSAS